MYKHTIRYQSIKLARKKAREKRKCFDLHHTFFYQGTRWTQEPESDIPFIFCCYSHAILIFLIPFLFHFFDGMRNSIASSLCSPSLFFTGRYLRFKKKRLFFKSFQTRLPEKKIGKVRQCHNKFMHATTQVGL